MGQLVAGASQMQAWHTRMGQELHLQDTTLAGEECWICAVYPHYAHLCAIHTHGGSQGAYLTAYLPRRWMPAGKEHR